MFENMIDFGPTGIELEVFLEENDIFMRSIANKLPIFEIEAGYNMGMADQLINAIENEELESQTVNELFAGLKHESLDQIPCTITDSRTQNVTTKTVLLKRRNSKS